MCFLCVDIVCVVECVGGFVYTITRRGYKQTSRQRGLSPFYQKKARSEDGGIRDWRNNFYFPRGKKVFLSDEKMKISVYYQF